MLGRMQNALHHFGCFFGFLPRFTGAGVVVVVFWRSKWIANPFSLAQASKSLSVGFLPNESSELREIVTFWRGMVFFLIRKRDKFLEYP